LDSTLGTQSPRGDTLGCAVQRQVCWAESGEDQDEAAAVGVVYGLGVNAARAARLPRTDAAVRGIDAAVARH
jgi:hypothetical protein